MNYKSNYQKALELAGAKCIVFEEFGDYQGTWVAKVEHKGKIKWLENGFGSCSGCDQIQEEIAFEHDEKKIKKSLKRIGRELLDQEQNFDDLVQKHSDAYEFDIEAKHILDFLEKHKCPA